MFVSSHDGSGVDLQGKKIKDTSSHLPGFMFTFALCFLNEPFISSRSIFTIFHI